MLLKLCFSRYMVNPGKEVAWFPVGSTTGKACKFDLQAPVCYSKGLGGRASWQAVSSQRGRKQVRQLSKCLPWRLIPVSG